MPEASVFWDGTITASTIVIHIHIYIYMYVYMGDTNIRILVH